MNKQRVEDYAKGMTGVSLACQKRATGEITADQQISLIATLVKRFPIIESTVLAQMVGEEIGKDWRKILDGYEKTVDEEDSFDDKYNKLKKKYDR